VRGMGLRRTRITQDREMVAPRVPRKEEEEFRGTSWSIQTSHGRKRRKAGEGGGKDRRGINTPKENHTTY